LVERFTLYEGELEYAESLLDDDVCNNSAWSYRFFILSKMPDSVYGTLEHARSEV
jgi:protein farnesyltransferase/geranylgeranyltransferase type-1 subunit alpha